MKLGNAEKDYISTLSFNLSTLLITVSKGRAWFEIEKGVSVKIAGVCEEDIKQAGVIQMMFGKEAGFDSGFNWEDVQKAFNYFDWDIDIVKGVGGVSFNGADRFLVVSVAYLMGGMDSKKYAECYREALENGERVFL